MIVEQRVGEKDREHDQGSAGEDGGGHGGPTDRGQGTAQFGAISKEHSSSELRVIGTNAHRIDSYFLQLTKHT